LAVTCFLKHVNEYNISNLRSALEEGWPLLNGGDAIFKSGDRVLLKPNMLSAAIPEKGITTHPAVISAVTEFLMDRGCHVLLGDSPAIESFQKVAAKAGYLDLLERYGIRPMSFDSGVYRTSKNRRWFPLVYLFDGLETVDHIINLPKLKTHSMMTLTLAVKNLFGCVPGKQKAAYHLSAGVTRDVFARLLLEIYETVNPTLTILDGIVSMEGNGPGQGTPRNTGIVIMGRNDLAIDALVGKLVGVAPDRHPIIKEALSIGMESADVSTINVVGDPIETVPTDNFKLPDSTGLQWSLPHFLVQRFRNWFTSRPKILNSPCIDCGKCQTICPVDAIGKNNAGLHVDKSNCIRCFCCHEVCPAQAVEIVKGPGLRILEFFNWRF